MTDPSAASSPSSAAAQSGNSFSRAPILITKSDLQRASDCGGMHVISLCFFAEDPPEKEWYRIQDQRLVRLANSLIVSIFFPTGITGKVGKRHVWHRCIVSFESSTPIKNSVGQLYLTPSRDGLNEISVKIGWMHNLDALHFKKYRSKT